MSRSDSSEQNNNQIDENEKKRRKQLMTTAIATKPYSIEKIFHIKEELKIHKEALFQMKDEEILFLLSLTKDEVQNFYIPKSDQIKIDERTVKCQAIRDRYKILFESEIHFKLMTIVKTLSSLKRTAPAQDIQPTDNILNMCIACESFQIDRLYKLLFTTFRKNEMKINAAIAFALFQNFTNFADFCALGEFAVLILESEAQDIKKLNNRKACENEEKSHCLEKEALEFEKEALQAGKEALNEEEKLNSRNIRKKHKAIIEGYRGKENSLKSKAKQNRIEAQSLRDEAERLRNQVKKSEKVILNEIAADLVNNIKKKETYSAKLEKFKEECIKDDGVQFSSQYTEITHFVKHCATNKDFESLKLEKVKDFTMYLREQIKSDNKTESYWTQAGTHTFHYHTFKVNANTYTLQIIEEVSTRKKTIVTAYKKI